MTHVTTFFKTIKISRISCTKNFSSILQTENVRYNILKKLNVITCYISRSIATAGEKISNSHGSQRVVNQLIHIVKF